MRSCGELSGNFGGDAGGLGIDGEGGGRAVGGCGGAERGGCCCCGGGVGGVGRRAGGGVLGHAGGGLDGSGVAGGRSGDAGGWADGGVVLWSGGGSLGGLGFCGGAGGPYHSSAGGGGAGGLRGPAANPPRESRPRPDIFPPEEFRPVNRRSGSPAPSYSCQSPDRRCSLEFPATGTTSGVRYPPGRRGNLRPPDCDRVQACRRAVGMKRR
jgi:hypothetical protein